MSYVEAIEYATPTQLATWAAHKERRRRLNSFYVPPPPRPVFYLPKPAPEEPLEVENELLPDCLDVASPPDIEPPQLDFFYPECETFQVTPARWGAYQFLRELICREYHVDISLIESGSRLPRLIEPRHLIMYLMHTVVGSNFSEIARLMKKKDHTTVRHAFLKVNRDKSTDVNLAERLSSFECALIQWMQMR